MYVCNSRFSITKQNKIKMQIKEHIWCVCFSVPCMLHYRFLKKEEIDQNKSLGLVNVPP